jgi:hypothetical protein
MNHFFSFFYTVAYSDSIFVNTDYLDHHTENSDMNVHPYLQKDSILTQTTINRFTYIQLLCLLVLCIFGLIDQPYVNVIFPIILALLIPFRMYILTYIFGENIDILDKLETEVKEGE